MPLIGYDASWHLVDATAVATAFTDAPMVYADGQYQEWYIVDRAKRWWSPDKPVTVTVNEVARTDLIIKPAGGIVRFNAPLQASDVVKASGHYLAGTNKVGGAKAWNFDGDLEATDVTSWDSGTWREFMGVMHGGTVSFEKWWVNDLLVAYLTAATLLGFEMRGSDNCMYYGYGLLTGDSIKAATSGAIEESLQGQISGAVGYVATP